MMSFYRISPVRSTICSAQLSRSMSGLIQVTKKDDYAIVRMNRKPVNSLNLELLHELDQTIQELEQDKTCRGMILGSNHPKIFSAGLDITEMYQPKKERLGQFWTTLQDTYLRLYSTKLTTIAAIEGNSPAGGCLLSICCDYRIMALGNYRIGLNETKLGIVAPFWFADTFINTIGHREAEKMLGLGMQITAEEAKKINLVDIAIEESNVMSKAEESMKEWLAIPDRARALTKQLLREKTINRLVKNKKQDLDNFVQFCEAEPTQKALGMYFAALKAKK